MAIFLPCYVLTVLPAPYFKKYGQRPGLIAFVDGVTAAAIGAIVVLGRRTVFADGLGPDPVKVVLLIATIGLLVRFKKLPEPVLIFAAGLIGLGVFPLFGR
ncbi:MAG: chromate transporter [Planctomycetaceae bacterium]|nr:chromate transporter [Planctomycetaceae bacterium]